jgi:predicted DNA-binding transcriptional regulator YafY
MTTPQATTSRLLALLSLLQATRDWPGPLLADRLGVSERTVRRDVDRLRAMGYAIHSGRGSAGGYRLEAGAQLPPLLLDDEQVTAIAVALQGVPLLGTGADEAAARALTTIRRVLPAPLRRRVDAVRFTPVVGPGRQGGPGGELGPGRSGAPAAVAADLLATLSTAVRAREVLRIDYGVTGDGATDDDGVPARPRRVEPHHLVAAGGRWYLLAWDLTRGDWRTFRVDRLTPRSPTGPRFTPRAVPGGDVAAFVTARFAGAGAAGTTRSPCWGSAVLHLPAERVAPFADDGAVEDLGDGRCRVSAGSWSWVALAAHLARFDAPIGDVRPAELTEAFALLADRCTAAATA